MDHLEEPDDADGGDEGEGAGQQIGPHEPADAPRAPGRRMEHEHTREAHRHEEHGGQEQDAEVEQPHARVVAEHGLQKREDDGADDRSDEGADAADVGHEQHRAGGGEAHVLGGEDLVVHREEPAGDAGEETGRAERDEADAILAIAHELRALGIVAHGVGHAPDRRA